MRALIGLTLAAATGWTAVAFAQGTEGPLAGPEAGASVDAVPAASAPPKRGPAHRAKIKTAHVRTTVPAASKLPLEAAGLPDGPALPKVAKPQAAASDKSSAAPTDPISFGMKWNGTNESGRETRIDNLNGDAAGVGGAVGLKLHF